MLSRITAYFKNLQVDTLEQEYKRIKENPSTLDKAIRDNNIDGFLTDVEKVAIDKKAKAKKQAELQELLKSDKYVERKKQVKTKSMNNMYTREFVRHNVDSDLAKMMTLMSKPARNYKIKKTIAQKLSK